MHKHRAVTKKRETVAYSGPVATPSNPAAHGGECVIEHCSCGATKRTNRHGKHSERGDWVEPKSGRSGAVWGDGDYEAKGYPPRLGTVRFKSWDAYRALERLSEKSGKTRTAVLEELLLAASQNRSGELIAKK